MLSLQQEWLQEGKQEGELKGEQKGVVKTLLRQLTQRFGDLPAEVREKINSADSDTLDRWVERVLDAQTVEGVLV
ncbi:MAG: DUF4351 domain-containing protein [Magnetococcales bacterium]|nr:DUF4351 domain-containing protein [Magnetococcales bacterium]